MVDTALFVSMSGAKETMRTLQIISNNLANANTIGFQADYESMKSFSNDDNNKMQTRVYSSTGNSYSDFRQGPLISTGGDFDIALSGPGFIAVQTKDGKEAYTRAGNLKLTPEGVLVTHKGNVVLSDKGILNIPMATRISINDEGEISAQLHGQSETQLTKLGKIKLVEIPTSALQKSEDGLFHVVDENAPVMETGKVKIKHKTLEGSNVDAVMALTQLIDTSRQFEMHTKSMKSIEENSIKSNQLLNVVE
jgi:flagellar basal-body rod protein FlgF